MAYIRIFLFILLTNLTANFSAAEAKEKIIFCISPPRSLSVAFMRMMQARGDFEIFHEPFHAPWCCKFEPAYVDIAYPPGYYSYYEKVKQSILEAAEKRPVFVKEVSFDTEDFLLNDPDFTKNENVHFVFLLRNPHHSLISFYKKSLFFPPNLNYLVGYEAIYNIYQKVKKDSNNKHTVIFSDELSSNPEAAVKDFCEAMNIPFIKEAMHWSPLDASFDYIKGWHEYRIDKEVMNWFGEAIKSSGFGKAGHYLVDEMGNPTFEEIANPEHREKCQEIYLHNQKFYELLLNDPDFLPQK